MLVTLDRALLQSKESFVQLRLWSLLYIMTQINQIAFILLKNCSILAKQAYYQFCNRRNIFIHYVLNKIRQRSKKQII